MAKSTTPQSLLSAPARILTLVASLVLFTPRSQAFEVTSGSSNLVSTSSITGTNDSVSGFQIVADLSSFADDLGGVSRVQLFRGQFKIELFDNGTGFDGTVSGGTAGDMKFSGSFGMLEGGTLATETFLKQSPFTFNFVSDFEGTPPIASSMVIQRLNPPINGKNIKVIAKFEGPNLAMLHDRTPKVSQLVLEVAGERVRFRDDGKVVDSGSLDGSFSAAVSMSEAEISGFARSNAAAVSANRGMEISFDKRSLTQRAVKPFDLAALSSGKQPSVKVLPPVAVTAQNLPKIRDRSLIVRDVATVEDTSRTYDPVRKAKGNPNGVWSFGRLAKGLANETHSGISTKTLLAEWVDGKLFSAAQHPSGDSVSARNTAKETFVRAWLKNSGAPVPNIGSTLSSNWKTLVKPEEFPVRLLAIVNRVDLRGNAAYGLTNPGEGRFVFCFVDSTKGGAFGANLNSLGTMTFIFEYGLPFSTCAQLASYAEGWWNLQSRTPGPVYNAALEKLTLAFTEPGLSPSKNNQSTLNHLRTNEFLQGVNDRWIIKDFLLTNSGHLDYSWLHEDTVEPGLIWNGPAGFAPLVSDLAKFVNEIDFSSGAGAPSIVVPENLKAIAAMMPPLKNGKLDGVVWQGSPASPMNASNRREFSLATCSGCHTAETGNTFFTHIRPRPIGVGATMSTFMTGGSVANPMAPTTIQDPLAKKGVLPPKQFNESLRRAIDLVNLVFKSECATTPVAPKVISGLDQGLGFKPVNMAD